MTAVADLRDALGEAGRLDARCHDVSCVWFEAEREDRRGVASDLSFGILVGRSHLNNQVVQRLSAKRLQTSGKHKKDYVIK